MEQRVTSVLDDFNADLDRSFGDEFAASGLARQRQIYDQLWRRYDAPRPAMVKTRDLEIPTRDGAGIAARLYWRGPEPAPTTTSLCLYFHGGGWAFGSIDSHDLVTARLAARRAQDDAARYKDGDV